MNKRTTTIILKSIPIISAILAILIVSGPFSGNAIDGLIGITFTLAGFGFVAFFIGRKMAKEDKLIRILGIGDLLSTFVIFFFCMMVFTSFLLA
ncbi:MAG: hypothetical protein J5802_13220 [Butyrivibrio sp.]|nr:hypothetical protein [Butyrivibrio sp.]